MTQLQCMSDEDCANLERRIITIPAEDWKAFEVWVIRSAEEIEGLKDLARQTPTWRECFSSI